AGTIINAPQLTALELDKLFSNFSEVVYINGKTFFLVIEITGLNIGSSANGHFYPYVFNHSATGSLTVNMEVEKYSVWCEIYDGPVSDYHVARVASTSGSLEGVRWTLVFPAATNIYMRNIGCIGRNNEAYQWNV